MTRPLRDKLASGFDGPCSSRMIFSALARQHGVSYPCELVWVKGQKMQSPREHRACCLVAGNQHAEQVVPELC